MQRKLTPNYLGDNIMKLYVIGCVTVACSQDITIYLEHVVLTIVMSDDKGGGPLGTGGHAGCSWTKLILPQMAMFK